MLHPCDVAYAFLVQLALSNETLAFWLSSVCFRQKFATFHELKTHYVNSGGQPEDLYGLEDTFADICTSPNALEENLESLTCLLGSHEKIHQEYKIVMGEERFGLLIRTVTLINPKCCFEELCRLYDDFVKFNYGSTDENNNNNKIISTKKEEDDDFLSGVTRLETHETVEKLHAYFDHASRKMTTLLSPTHPFSESLRNDGYPNRKAVFMQHAVLELATIHHKLGNDKEAFYAAREAVIISQQNLDEVRLEASLNLFRRLDVSGNVSNHVDLKSDHGCLERAREILWGNVGNPRRPRSVWHELSQVTGAKHQVRQALLRSDAWEQFGHGSLATVWTQSILSNPSLSIEESVLAYCRLALVKFARGKSAFSLDGEFHFSSPYAIIGRCFLNKLNPKELLPVMETILDITHTTLVKKRDFEAANYVRLLAENSGFGNLSSFVIEELVSAGCKAKAYEMLNKIRENSNSSKIIEADVLLRCAKLFQKERALSFALRSWALAKEMSARTLCAVASVEVARARMEMGKVDEAIEIIKKALPQIAAHSSSLDFRQAEMLMIKCKLKRGDDKKLIVKMLQDFIRKLQGEESDVSLMEDSYYLLAMIYDSLQMLEEREEAANQFFAIRNSVESCDIEIEAVDRAIKYAAVACSTAL